MKEITIEIDEKKYNFFLDLLKNFDFVSIKKNQKKIQSSPLLKECARQN